MVNAYTKLIGIYIYTNLARDSSIFCCNLIVYIYGVYASRSSNIIFHIKPLSAFRNASSCVYVPFTHTYTQIYIQILHQTQRAGPNHKKKHKTKQNWSKSMSHNAINLLHLYAVSDAAWLFIFFWFLFNLLKPLLYPVYGVLFWVAFHPHPSITPHIVSL